MSIYFFHLIERQWFFFKAEKIRIAVFAPVKYIICIFYRAVVASKHYN